MPDALLDRIRETMAELKMVELDVAAGDADNAITKGPSVGEEVREARVLLGVVSRPGIHHAQPEPAHLVDAEPLALRQYGP